MDKEEVSKILEVHAEMTAKIEKALIAAGIPKRKVFFYTFKFPDFNELLPEDVVAFFDEVRAQVILYLKRIGFSQREISRRLKGSAYHIVVQVLRDRYTQNKFASPEEVQTKGGEEEDGEDN